ncbi:MAG: FxsA family protein [Parvularculaceae bacterium]|nr:FxsA family protein [Parvularculaceae bacterium]
MNIGFVLFVLFVVVPVLEIAAFIQIGGAIGTVPTLLGCVATAVIGAYFVRLQGFGVLMKAQTSLARNELPVDQLAHGAFILVAGVLLMTPGYVTDALGFTLLVPAARMRIARWVVNYFKDRADVRVVRSGWGESARDNGADARGRGVTIEGEAVEIDDGK